MLVFAVLVLCRAVGKLSEHDTRALLALADLGATFLPLLIRCPFAGFIALGLGGSPQAHGIDAAIWFLARYVDGREGESARGVPRHAPVAHILFDCVDGLGRNARVNVPLVGCGI